MLKLTMIAPLLDNNQNYIDHSDLQGQFLESFGGYTKIQVIGEYQGKEETYFDNSWEYTITTPGTFDNIYDFLSIAQEFAKEHDQECVYTEITEVDTIMVYPDSELDVPLDDYRIYLTNKQDTKALANFVNRSAG